MEDLQLEQLVGKKFYFSGKLGKTHLVQFEWFVTCHLSFVNKLLLTS
jgi:hypothetical protein